MTTDVLDHSIQQLPLLVPSEAASSLGLFRQQISLYHIVSELLDQLYTTWSRRDGIAKIRRLEDKLTAWKAGFQFHSATQPLSTAPSESFPLFRLQVLADFAKLLLHRPALSFNEAEPQFHESLKASVEASDTLIPAIQESIYSRRLIRAWPLATSAVLQLGLTLLYPFWIDAPYARLYPETIRRRIAAVCDLIAASTPDATMDAYAGGAEGPQQNRVSSFLTELSTFTLDSPKATSQGESSSRTRDTMVSSQADILENMNLADWPSIMLPNNFLISEMDLAQNFET